MTSSPRELRRTPLRLLRAAHRAAGGAPGPLLALALALALAVAGCAFHEPPEPRRSAIDRDDAAALRDALLALPAPPDQDSVDPREVAAEADLLATTLVRRTRAVNREYQMWGSPGVHNCLILAGVRHHGFCYEWVPALLEALPPQPLRFFERTWALALKEEQHENNALVLTRRGAPLHLGLVYDAWRGLGHPYWLRVEQDREWSWFVRFFEDEILAGRAHVVPVRRESGHSATRVRLPRS